MEVLILLRHGKAVGHDEAESDRARGLTARGKREAAEAGRQIAEGGFAPDKILVSPAARTRETYEALAPCFDAKPTFVDDLYMATDATIWSCAAHSGGNVVLVIGHNPGLHELAADLVTQAKDNSKRARQIVGHVPTSGFAAFSVTGAKRQNAGPRLLSAWRPDPANR
jgi:phosphohistidine phosphatase